ncbi:Dynein heavy chain 1 [Channa argus]|uniref:Dynein heavy chain 1 n=1 Tax=Channa argus TaxID=215402 RepID=A0A6G1PGS8_CHAAH|nr:Dynein heavy chain 1 [Channa argus]
MDGKYVPTFGLLVPHPPSKPPEPKPPTRSHRLPPIRKNSMHEQRGIYSDIITTFKFQGGNTPKVQMPYQTKPGQIPRKLEIERCRREYLQFDFEQLLAEKGIDSKIIMPRHPSSSVEHVNTSDVSPYLSLEIFDNEEYDCRTPEDWLALGNTEGLTERKPIPAKALLPTDDNIPSEDTGSFCMEYSWHLVGVLDYSKVKCQYLVQKVPLSSKDENSKSPGVSPLVAGTKYWVPRIRLLFIAEDPRIFVERIQFALKWRENTEALLLYHLSVDCMPIWSGTPSLDTESLHRMKKYALSTPGLRLKIVENRIRDLEKEVKLEYYRTMNRMSFNKVVMNHPAEFSHIILPKKEPEYVPHKGCVPVPQFASKKKQAAFAFHSLLTKPEVICVLSEVWSECSNVANMRLFNVTLIKPLRLDEFEVTQSQLHSQISVFLRESWRVTLSNSIRSNLGSIGSGSYNVNESQWDMYKISKLYKLMGVVRFRMQDSLRYLVQDSLVSLTCLVLDACHSVLTCSKDLVWGNDLITSPYKPKKNPLFLLDLVLDQTGVHFNTPPENFERSVINLFDKSILATYNVQQLEKKLFIGGDHLLESVNLWEPEVTKLRAKVQNALVQAALPLRAYATEYEKFLELHNSDIETLLSSFVHEEQTSQEVKAQVEHQLQEKERIQHSLPTSIVIGPFIVRVEAVRLALSNKRKALATSILDRLARKLRKQVEDACEECNSISRKLNEKPNSIEELTEKRDWMKQIPEQLKSYKVQTEGIKQIFLSYISYERSVELALLICPQQECIGKTLADYEVIEEFHYCLSDDDVNKKWKAIGGPQRIISQMETVTIQHVEDEERFQKILLVDKDSFEEHLDSLKMLVAGFAGHADIRHVQEIASEVRRTTKQLKECQTMAQTYNNRERLFGIPVTNYDCVQRLVKDFQPFKDLWTTTSDWIRWHESWMNDPLSSIDAEQLQRNVTEAHKTMHKCIKQFKEIPDCQMLATLVRNKIEDFQPYIPLFEGLRNPGMRMRHWEMLSEHIQMKVVPKANLTFSRCLELGLQNHVNVIAQVAEVAGKEYTIEQALEKMENEWLTVVFDVLPYKETGTYILKSPDEVSQLLDDHIVMTQSMSFSPFKKAFEERIDTWESKLRMTQDVVEEWLTCQRSWLYLEPIFSSDDINQQLPVEGKRYKQVEQTWKRVMKNAFNNPKVIELCPDARLLEKLKECNILLEQVQKGLSEYLETKRGSFPRFYFLSDDELLEILSQTKDPTAVQPHLRKCFENIAQLQFQSDLQITHMYSGEGEEVKLFLPVWPTGNVEDWLRDVERSMKATLRDNIDCSLKVYPKLGDLVQLVRGGLSKNQRAVLSALIVIEVHAKDVVSKLVEQKVSSVSDFEWISQLRYYWAKDDLYTRAVNAEFLYGYEYLGNSGRLVITPLTDRCYLTLTGALHLKFGGAPAGPAGTGKTETTKDLGKALAIQTVVFNCSDQLDFIAMGKFLKGLASSGAWACFDEFNRIDVEVLSVVAQQITTIQKAQQQRAERFVFEGAEIPLVPSCAVFITMNPGYAGRTELPDNLKALFRPVAMMVPDYAMIAEISLYSFGFSDAKVLSKKITTTFKLSSEQLSSQELICLRAIQDVNVPKFLQDDLKLFNGIVSDLFPKTKQEPINYGTLEESMRNVSKQKNLEDVDGYIKKCIQLYETTVVRHGLMLVGPSGSGKTKCYEILGAALTALKGQPSVSGGVYESVQTYVLNPKSITMGQLYGEYDLLTHEWTDGILSSLIRGGASSMDKEKKWYMFDGPVDAVWIENMNTVLDDNKKLCLSSGEIIKLTDVMTMMFEVQDLAVASPATVSRCGMVYLEPSILGLNPFIDCWLKQVPNALKVHTGEIRALFARFLQVSITFVRTSVKEVITSLDSNLTFSLLKLMDCFFNPFDIKEEERPPPQKKLDRLKELIEPWFFFSLVWSVGATGDAASCQRFSAWLKNKMAEEKINLCFPEEGLVYDYRLDDAGISNLEEQDEDEERNVQWVSWMKDAEIVEITPETNYADIIVPTADTVRMSFLMDMLLTNRKPVLCVGPTGTGKTLIMSNKLLKTMPAEYITHFLMFSARTSANQTQDYIDNKLDKRRKGVFGPPVGKYFIFFIDDLNMPMLETYGAQPPIELLRQWMDHAGWYDRKQIGTFKLLVDINFACAMGPPGGGRNPITQRFTRHFNFLSFTEMDDASKKKIFSTILGSWMEPVPEIQPLNESLVDATIRVYSTITSQLLPTPAKSHYTFNLRDLSKVFQGIFMAEAKMIENIFQLLQLWYHESCRVFQDRLVCAEDRDWFNMLLKDCIQKFNCNFEEVVCCQPVLYGDFMIPGADHKVYKLIEDNEKLVKVMEEYMEDYNQTSTTKMKLVLFMDAIEHVCRISRILRQPLGNALLLGVGGSGRQSLTKLASYISEYECFQIELSKNYGQTEWKEDIKSIMMRAGLQNQQITFLFVDTQIKSESFLEDINNILNSGDVPNLYAADEQERILTSMKPVVLDLGQQPTKANLLAAYIRRLLKTAEDVSKMQKEIEAMGPDLEQASKDIAITMETIKKETLVAEETRKSVQEDEAKASEKASVAGAIAADAQRDLDEALPALDAALTSLKSLNKNDITEVRAMQRPPQGVKLVIEAVCIMKGIKPKKVPGEKPGTKVDDYWEPGKALLQDPGKFLESLFKYDKDNIPDSVISLVQPYIDNEEFQPASIAKVSKACTSICQWVRAMHVYHFVSKAVKPKRQALQEAQEDLAVTQHLLNEAKEKLAAVESSIVRLQATYQGSLAKKDDLDNKYQLCQTRLIRADKLINGLADEKVRWKETVKHLDYMVNNVAGDVFLSAGFVAYLGPFTGEYRAAMAEEWLLCIKELNIPHTEESSLISTLEDPVKIRSWQISGLPKDKFSVENGVITHYSLRWALFIDPQGQANTWIKNMERDNGLEVMKLSDRDFLRNLENAIRFGKPCLLENVGEELDPALEPVLLQQTFKQQGSTMLKLGDSIIPYHESFKMYMTSKLPNPHYSPEVSTRVTLINFTLSPSGLQDQLLGQVVAEERPDLEEAKNQLIISNAKMKQELKEIEDEILFRLSSTEGNPVDNEELIQVLEASKIKAGEIKAKVIVAEKTEKDIDATRLEYVPVAVRAQILFFCVSDLSNVDPMYQYSLEWYLGIFMAGIANSERADTLKNRIANINEFFTFSLYSNVCRSLFEKHKLMFSFLLCARILMNENKIDMAEWRYLLSGGMPTQELTNPATSDLSAIFTESSPSTPLIFVLSPGTDPAADLYKFADVMQFSKKLNAISLGQGQGPWAEAMMHTAMERGQWVFFQNCHLAPSWMPSLERLIENISPTKVHKDFRLWLTSLPSNKFPVSILQNGSKMTIEPPRGIKANLQKTYLRLTNDFISSSTKISNFKSLLLSLCLFHGIALERRKFGPLGFNIPYEFTDGDLNICISQLKMFLDEYQDIPYKVLKYTAGEINYGGRVTDDWDRRCLLSVLEDFYCSAVLVDDHVYSSSGVYRQIDTKLDVQGYLAYIRSLPINDTPEIFGLHDNANISFAQNETFALLGAVVCLQPRAASTGGKTLEEIVEEIVAGIAEKIPPPFSVQEVMEKYPVLYEESMNTVLIQEVIRYNKLLVVISHSLTDIVKALKGLVVMSSELELMANSLFNNVAYPSLKPLASWVSDLLQRINFLRRWISKGIPPVFWISGFFFPQAFLTGTLQNYARRSGTSIDTIGFDFEVIVKLVSEIKEKPNTGCYIHGLFLEGARWDNGAGQLTESRPKELHTEMAVIWLIPKPNRRPPASGVYICPIYKTLTRAGQYLQSTVYYYTKQISQCLTTKLKKVIKAID